MYEESLELLKTLEQNGFKAYIVGGFVRDKILNLQSTDIDICTDATPKQLKETFNVDLKNIQYGSVTVIKNKIRFEITTMRKEIGYVKHRTPKKIKYINNLYDDLKRRDFTINTLCINSEGEIIDLLDGLKDIKDGIIKIVDMPTKRIKEDALRILRALRFATVLNFKLDNSLEKAIKEYGYLLKDLSYFRKKSELDKIFLSPNAKYGISLIINLGLEEYLDIKLDNVILTNNLIGIWAQIDKELKYEYSNYDRKTIIQINELLDKDILDNSNLYHYSLYSSTIAAEIKNIDKKEVVFKYNNLPIKSKKEINISSMQICEILNKEPGNYLNSIFNDLENSILNNKVNNNYIDIKDYLIKKYS